MPPSPPLSWKTSCAAYAVAAAAMLALDAVWLGGVALEFYRRELGALMSPTVRIVPAALYYLGYPAAVVYLALQPRPPTLGTAVLRSAVLGVAAFGVYDLTNLATLRGYSVAMTLVDMAYGAFATAVGGGLAYRWVLARGRAAETNA